MVYARYKTSVPGSVMLLGEHAVLYGSMAIACAIDQRLTVELFPHSSQEIIIISDRLGEYACKLQNLQLVKPFEFVIAAILHFHSELFSGFKLKISSEFSEKMGLGSSAAVTAAVVITLNHWLSKPFTTTSLFETCLAIIRSIQGIASGADLAASLLGGVVALKPHPLKLEKLLYMPNIELFYCGYKTPTAKVIKQVSQAYSENPLLFKALFKAIGSCTNAGYHSIQQKDWQGLGKIFLIQQHLLEALGVSNDILEKMITELYKNPAVLGAKISGSGLGDCVVALTNSSSFAFSFPQDWQAAGIRKIPGKIDLKGAWHESK